MTPVRLNRQITIERISSSTNTPYGTEAGSWVPLAYQHGSPAVAAKFWAEVQDVMPSRDERATEGLSISLQRTRIRMRYRDDVTSAMRVIVHGDSDRIMNIIGGPAEIGGRKQYIEFLAEERSS